MADQKWHVADLCLRSRVLSDEEITQALGIKPSRVAHKGEPLSQRNPNSRLREDTVWILGSGLSTDIPLDQQIEKLFESISGREDKFIYLKEKDVNFQLYFYCGYSTPTGQGSVVLDADLMQRMVEIGAYFLLDFYGPECDE